MAYADYKFYTGTFRGTLSESDFTRLSERASDYIDSRTDYVLHKSGIPPDMELRIQKCCCALADTIHSCEEGGVKSAESVDGYSVSYAVSEKRTPAQRMDDDIQLYMLDEDILPDERVRLIPPLIFPEVPPDPQLGDFILWFYSCGRRFGKGKSGKGKKKSAVYSFEYDDGYIYAAFLEKYGIDLTSVEYLHWWKFKALFKSLHDCKLCEIMAYRSDEITDKTPLWRRKQIEECQRIYALPKSLSEQQKIAEAIHQQQTYINFGNVWEIVLQTTKLFQLPWMELLKHIHLIRIIFLQWIAKIVLLLLSIA